MNWDYHAEQIDYGPNPYVADIEKTAVANTNFRTAVWTGCHLQMTVMSIPPCGEIGLEVHEYTDQFIRIEQGEAVVMQGNCKHRLDYQRNVCKGDGIFIPAGMWHNVVNIGRNHLKLSTIYAPPHHLRGTVHPTKLDAQRAEE